MVEIDHLHAVVSLRYVAVKVGSADQGGEQMELKLLEQLSADSSSSHAGRQHVQKLQDQFKLSGPVGSHQCLVFKPAGRDLQQMISQDVERRRRKTFWSLEISRTISKQLLLALDYLHSHRIVHRGMFPREIRVKSTLTLCARS